MSSEVNSLEETNFVDLFYETINTFKSNLIYFSTAFFCKVFLYTFVFYFSSTTDDATKILVTLIDAFLSMVIFVFIINLYFSKINDISFSMRKSLWDMPTYVYYELAFGVLSLLGAIAFVLPGLFVFYMFSFVPVVSILFDYDEKEGIFAATKRYISKKPTLYFIVFVINLLMGIISFSSETIISYLPHNVAVFVLVAIVLTFFGFITTALVVSFFNQASSVERRLFLQQNS